MSKPKLYGQKTGYVPNAKADMRHHKKVYPSCLPISYCLQLVKDILLRSSIFLVHLLALVDYYFLFEVIHLYLLFLLLF